MKVVYNDITNDNLTYNKEYETIELYIHIDTQEKAFRVIDDTNKPYVYSSDMFNYDYIALDNMVLCEYDKLLVFTLKQFYEVIEDNISILEFWDYYLDGGYFTNNIQNVIDGLINK